MRNYLDNAQDFADEWTTRMGIPHIPVLVSHRDSKIKGSIKCCEDYPQITLYENNINNHFHFVFVLLHELCHWWYFWRFAGYRFRDERRVIIMSTYLLKKFYPQYFDRAIEYAVEFVADLDMVQHQKHYYGYLDCLRKFGIIEMENVN